MSDGVAAPITLDRCRVNVLRGGSAGEPILFLHGAGGGGTWLPFMGDLAQSHRVIAPEHPGFGGSEMPPWLDGMHDLAFFYLDFLKAEGIERVHVVGHSLGGWLAAEMAMIDASRLASLTLVAPAGLRVPGAPVADIFLFSPEERARSLYVDAALTQAELDHVPDDAENELRAKNRFAAARLAWQPRFYDPLLAKWLPRVTLPTLILWGEQDRIIPVAHAAAYRALLPQAELVVLSQFGHIPQVEKRADFVGAVSHFIAGIGR